MNLKYFRYLPEANVIVLAILSPIKLTGFYLSSTNISRDSLFGHVIYSSGDAHSWQCASPEDYNISKAVNPANNGAREMKLPDGSQDSEHIGVGFVEMSRIVAQLFGGI